MRTRATRLLSAASIGAATVAAALALGAGTADARCTRLGFSVNDYGKDGPTKDAQDLLDKYIAKWAVENGVKKYSTGKKTVSCELFLDFILFDEHTCKAEATVCWGDGNAAAGAAAAKPAAAEGQPAAAGGAAPKAKAPAAKPPAPKAKAAAAN
jgi:hypothetical protein